MAVGVAVGEMLAEEEHMHLVCPYHIADEQIVCPLIAILARLLRRPAGFDEDFFMRIVFSAASVSRCARYDGLKTTERYTRAPSPP